MQKLRHNIVCMLLFSKTMLLMSFSLFEFFASRMTLCYLKAKALSAHAILLFV